MPLKRPPERGGKDEDSDSCILGKERSYEDNGILEESQPCGICLVEVDDQGRLDCCQHVYCFDCIMKWSQVESRCPTCKRRFRRVTRVTADDGGGRGSLRHPRSFPIPLKDQVYQPSAEDLAAAMEPYANTVCMVCLECDHEHLLLLCDVCDGAAHTYCVGLGHSVPDGDWFCHTCAGTADGATSDSDASVDQEELGESSDSGTEAEEGAQHIPPAGGTGATNEDSDTEFCLNIQLDAQPARITRTRHARRLRSSRGVADVEEAAGSGRALRPVRRRGNGTQQRSWRSSEPLPNPRTVLPGDQRGGMGEGLARGLGAAWGRRGSGDGPARTLQAQVQDRLTLRLMRDNWPALRRGALQFAPRSSSPVMPPQAAPQTNSKPKVEAGSESEKLAWKALRALRSGEGDVPSRESARQGPRAGAAKKGGGKGSPSRGAAREVKLEGTRPGSQRALTKGLVHTNGKGVRADVERGGGTKQGGARAQRVGPTGSVGEAGLGSPAQDAAGALVAWADTRRQANAGWVDEELLHGLEERGGSAGGTRGRSTPPAWQEHSAPPNRAACNNRGPTTWSAGKWGRAVRFSAGDDASQRMGERGGRSRVVEERWGGGNQGGAVEMPPSTRARALRHGSWGYAAHKGSGKSSPLTNSRVGAGYPCVFAEQGKEGQRVPSPMMPQSSASPGYCAPLPAPPCPSSAPAAPIQVGTPATPMQAEVRQLDAACTEGDSRNRNKDFRGSAHGTRWPLRAASRKEAGGVACAEASSRGTEARAGVACAGAELDGRQHEHGAAGEQGSRRVAAGVPGLEAAKRVKDELAKEVKEQLGPLYKSRVIDKTEFREAAKGASRALLQGPLAQTLYEELKRAKQGAVENDSTHCWWCCKGHGSKGPKDGRLPFCQECIKRQIGLSVEALKTNRTVKVV